MTMPHLMNCSHAGDGWCLLCVSDLGTENIQLLNEVECLRLFRDSLKLVVESDGVSAATVRTHAANLLKILEHKGANG